MAINAIRTYLSLALAAALLLVPEAARAQANATCGALASGVANCPNAAYANGIHYWAQASGVRLTVPGTATTTTITAGGGFDGLDTGVSIRTAAHATETRNVALTVGGTGTAVAIVQGSSPAANAWYRNQGILVSPLTANGSTVTVDVRSGVTIGASGNKMRNRGIVLWAVAGAGAVSVTSAATIHSGREGIYISNVGAGATTVGNSGAVTSDYRGIHVLDAGSAGAVTVTSSGAVTAGGDGIFAQTTRKDADGDNADVTVTHSAGAVSSTGGMGIRAHVGAARQEANTEHADYVAPKNAGLAKVSVTGGSVRSMSTAIEALNYEAGSVAVDVSEGVTLTSTGMGAVGINAQLADVGNTDGTITVTSAGRIVAASGYGIVAIRRGGSGAVTVTNRGAIEAGGDGDGIYVVAAGAGGAVTVGNSGAVGKEGAAAARGIFVSHDGSGSGTVSVTNAAAIHSGKEGIYIRNAGAGATTVGNSGAVTSDSRGIHVLDSGSAGAVTVTSSGAVTAGGDGILAQTTGKDADGDKAGVTVTHSAGAVSSSGGWGIKAHVGASRQEANSGHDDYVAPENTGLAKVSVTGGSVRSTLTAIEAFNYEAGSVEVVVSEGVTLTSTGMGASGINAQLADVGNTAGTITVTSAGRIVAASGYGIVAIRRGGSGAVTVTNRGAIEAGGDGDGIYVVAAGAGGAVTVTNRGAVGKAGAAAARGIFVSHDGSGSGTVSVTNAAAIHSGREGIHIRNAGAGATTVGNSGAVTSDSRGIHVLDSGSAGAVTVTSSGAVTAGGDGILAQTTGKDADGDKAGVTVTHSAGAVSSSGGWGIKAHVGASRQEANSGHDDYVAPENTGLAKVSVTGGSVRSTLTAIEAFNYEAGSVEVVVSEGVTLTSTGMGASGINAQLADVGNTAGTITVTSAGRIVAASGYGIVAIRRGGSGAVTVTNRGAIEAGGDGDGIYVTAAGAGGAVTVDNSGAVGKEGAAVARGIFVSHDGSGAGAVSVTSAAAIHSGKEGIFAQTTGKDADGDDVGVTVTHSAGAISSTGGAGIRARVGTPRQETDTEHADYVAPMNAGLAKVSVTGGSVSSTSTAIQALNHEAGSVEVSVSEGVTLTSATGRGIHAELTDAGNPGGTLSVTQAGTIRVAKNGINALRWGGAGAVTVTNSGAIETGSDGYGIFVVARGAGGTVTVDNSGALGTTAAPVAQGIFVSHDGVGASGGVTVESSGAITATDKGILARVTGQDVAGANVGVTVTHSAGAIVVASDEAIRETTPDGSQGVKEGLMVGVGGWRGETDTGHARYVAPVNTGLAKATITGGSITSKGNAVEVTNYEAGGVEIGISAGVELTSTHDLGIEADLRDVGNKGGTIRITQAGAISAAKSGVSAKVAWAGGAGPDRVIDVTWTGTFASRASQPTPLANIGNTLGAARSRILGEDDLDIHYAQGYAGIDAGVMKLGPLMDVVTASDDPGAFADAAAVTALFDAGADAATKARAAAIVAQFRALLGNEDLETIPGADDVDADGDGSYSDTEITAYLSADDDRRRILLRNVLALSFTDEEKAVFEALLRGDDVNAALDAVPGASDAWKREVRALVGNHNTGDVRIAVNGGSIDSSGDGVRAWYAKPHDMNGAIAVTVAAGATVEGDVAGIYVANAGATGLMVPNRYAPDAAKDAAKDGDAPVALSGHLNQLVTVHGTVTGGTDAAVHLSGGGALIVGRTGKLVAGSSGRAILVNDPGPAHIHIEGEVTGGAGAAGAVHLTGEDSTVTVGSGGRVEASGAASAIRTDEPGAAVVIAGEVKGGAGGEAAVHLAGGGTVTIRPPADPDAAPRVDANGAALAIRGGAGTTTTVEIETTGSVRDGDAAREVASKAVSGSYANIGGEVKVTAVQMGDGVRTGHTLQLAEDGTLAFKCEGAGDGRCGLYEALPSVLLSANGPPSYAERAAAARDGNGGWALVDAARGKWRARRATTSGKLAYDHRRTVGRAGLDFAVVEHARAGVSMHFLGARADMSGVGEIKLEGLGAGVSGTWLEGGFHVDAQAGVTWYGVELKSDVHGELLDKDASGRGYALGLEAGRRLAVGGDLTVTPRAGLVWSKVGLGDFGDTVGDGARVSVQPARSIKGGVGVSAETEVEFDGTSGLLFGTLDLEREFSDGTRVDVGAVSLSENTLRTKARRMAVRVGVGGRFSLDGNVSLSASARYGTGGSGTNWYGGGLKLDVRF